MKKLIFSIVLLLLIFSNGLVAEANSYSIDSVHIKSWIQPNGDLLVNEVFTYSFDGEFNHLSRSFPTIHEANISDFQTYELTLLSPEPGFIDDKGAKALHVSKEDGVYRTKIKNSDEKVSFLYMYTLKNSVKAYDSYSELKVTYFEEGAAHDQDFHHVTIDYILPETMDPTNFEGVLFDRNAEKNGKSPYGIRFITPVSEAYSETKTSFFFPSAVMTGMNKTKAPVSLDDALENERAGQQQLKERLSHLDQLIAIIPKISFGIFIIAILSLVLLPQRHFWRKGIVEDALHTDILYLFFVDRTGKPNIKAFLAGLFSMVEKGAITVKETNAAPRFKNDPKAPKETLDFHLIKGELTETVYEIHMIKWLFQTKKGSSRWTFCLHDAAGAAREEKNPKNADYFQGKIKDFKKKQKEWHKIVEKELEEAGTFNSKLPFMLISLAIIILSTLTSFAYYADLRSGWGIGFIVLITFIVLIMSCLKKGSKRYFGIYIILMLFVATSLVNDELVDVITSLIFAVILLYMVLPRNILSMNAVRAKDAIRTFRKSLGRGLPVNLSEKEHEKWIVRAYLFGRKKRKVPLQDMSIPLAAVLLTGADPLEYVTKSWKWTKVSSPDGGSSGGDSGGGGGSDGGGGGGAGAD